MTFRKSKSYFLAKAAALIALAWLLPLARQAQAAEGFSTSLSSAPDAVKVSFAKSFAILTDYPKTYDLGSAALIGKVKTQSTWELYFLTASHVLDQRCLKGKVCSNTYLVQEFRGKTLNNALSPDPLSGLVFDEVEVVDRESNPDLAILHVSADLAVAGIPEPIELPVHCDLAPGQPLYTVGYPATFDRVNPSSATIQDKNEIEKRWSRGIFIDNVYDGAANDMRLYFGTTIDALGGNSGGPVIDAEGKIVGVLVKAAGEPANGFRYDGSEIPGKLDWHSLSLRCEYLQKLKSSLEELNSK